jgi:outer membrane protein OmpU
MKKILIATTALVATAGMASADITITGSANAGYYSGLSNKDGAAAVTAATTTSGGFAYIDADGGTGATPSVVLVTDGTAAVTLTTADTVLAGKNGVPTSAASVGTYTDAGIYSNAGIVATMTGATDGGITFSASVDAEAGTEVDTGDFELDGAASGAFGLGAVSMTGAFGTITFDDNGIDNLYDDDLVPAHDVKYATTVGGVALTVATNAQQSADQTSMSAAYTSGAMTFTVATSDSTAGTSASALVSYVVSDSLTVRAKTDQAAGKESTQKIGITTALNGISIVADTVNNSTWDVSLGYTVNGVALTYANDEADAWSASASYALGGGATAKAGINAEDSMYAGVSFAF